MKGYKTIIILILILGCIIRIVAIDKIPDSLNVDEASAGYEAFSILNYGIDRNGKTLPVFLEAWGSGQNALYTYLMIPFVKIIGLNLISIRLPMAIAGCISLFVMYKILEKQDNKKITIIGLAFFAIAPWHIMKSRFGLESNIFPDIMLWATYFLINGKYYIGSVLLGICGYAYGTSYYFLPIFFIALLIVLIRKKEITIKQAVISLTIVFVICLPIICMLAINSFDLNEIKIGNITIPRLESNRYETLTVLSSKNVIKTLITNFVEGIKIIVTQSDGKTYNSLPLYGTIYLTSLPVMIVGIIKALKNKTVVI